MPRVVLIAIGVLFLFAAVRCWLRSSRSYRIAKSILFLVLGIPFLVAGVFYTASSYSGFSSGGPNPATPQPTVIAATPLPVAPPREPGASVSIAPPLPYDEAVRQAQKAAVARYPALGVADSPFNRMFVSAYRRLREQTPEFFDDPNWPISLAEEVAREERSPR